jgi:hypothetical protein
MKLPPTATKNRFGQSAQSNVSVLQIHNLKIKYTNEKTTNSLTVTFWNFCRV